jgi:hypothetical protein
MITLRITSLFKFLIGILLLQVTTALGTYIALQTDLAVTGMLFAALGGTLGLLVTLWFESIADSIRDQAITKVQKRHSREREKIRLQAERDKAKIEAKRRRGMGGAQLKTGAAVGGVLGLGIAMMLAQAVTLGLLTVSVAGGAALGYSVRGRQEKRLRIKEMSALPMVAQEEPAALIEQPSKRRSRRTDKT